MEVEQGRFASVRGVDFEAAHVRKDNRASNWEYGRNSVGRKNSTEASLNSLDWGSKKPSKFCRREVQTNVDLNRL